MISAVKRYDFSAKILNDWGEEYPEETRDPSGKMLLCKRT